MRTGRAVVTCATTALAMVFSVQQGEHGPLVVYKLQIPEQAATAAPPPAEPVYVIPSRAPRVLGNVTMPSATRDRSEAATVSVLDIIQQLAPAAAPRQAAPEREWDWNSEEAVTLDQVNADISWRRETAEKLRQLPFSPRF